MRTVVNLLMDMKLLTLLSFQSNVCAYIKDGTIFSLECHS